MLEAAERPPTVEEAGRILSGIESAGWWVFPVRKRFMEEPGRSFSRVLERWAVSRAREAGLRVRQVRRAFDQETAAVIVKAETPEGKPRVLYVAAVVGRAPFGGKKMLMAEGAMIVYGTPKGKTRGLLDGLRPFLRRSYRVEGYAVSLVRVATSVNKEGVRSREAVRCERIAGIVSETQRKYFLFLLLFFVWNWYYIVNVKILSREPAEFLCEAVLGGGQE